MKKNNYLKKLQQFIYLILFCGFIYFLYLGMESLVNLSESIGEAPEVNISGYMNNISSFILFGFLLPTIPFGLLTLFTGLQFPKLAFIITLIGAALVGIGGHYTDSKIRAKLNNFNYQECLSERQLALKYSSRTYVLDLKLCNED